ncbi:MAG TPA: SRPBCC family protein [Rhizomicrobium sp.]|jgi:uncharacterized protein YndB with AHSA1/START domain
MSSTAHATFTIDRELDAPIELVFQAFADPAHKARWFKGPPEWRQGIREHDFRVGGNDRLKGEWAGGDRPWKVSDFTAEYRDIVENKRIVYVYEMTIDGVKISVSLATVEFQPKGKGTRLRVTEQGAFLDGYDDAGRRREGVSSQLDVLAETLRDG